MCRIRRRVETRILEEFFLAIESHFHSQAHARFALHSLAEGSEHLLARAERRMAPGLDLGAFRQCQANGANLFKSLLVSSTCHRRFPELAALLSSVHK